MPNRSSKQRLQMVIHPLPATLRGLTVREIDVLRLVAAGGTYREIADGVVSENAGINKVTHIVEPKSCSYQCRAAA
jgi:FixJ family two-component response regulator